MTASNSKFEGDLKGVEDKQHSEAGVSGLTDFVQHTYRPGTRDMAQVGRSSGTQLEDPNAAEDAYAKSHLPKLEYDAYLAEKARWWNVGGIFKAQPEHDKVKAMEQKEYGPVVADMKAQEQREQGIKTQAENNVLKTMGDREQEQLKKDQREYERQMRAWSSGTGGGPMPQVPESVALYDQKVATETKRLGGHPVSTHISF